MILARVEMQNMLTYVCYFFFISMAIEFYLLTTFFDWKKI